MTRKNISQVVWATIGDSETINAYGLVKRIGEVIKAFLVRWFEEVGLEALLQAARWRVLRVEWKVKKEARGIILFVIGADSRGS